MKGHPDVVYRINSERRAVALTIDDGPDRESTPRILDVLAQHEATATFFVISERIAGNELLMRRITSSGHDLGNHMTRDEASIALRGPAFEEELLRAQRTLSTYAHTRWFRPGSGWFDKRMLSIVQKHEYSCVLGKIYPLDTVNTSSWLASKFILWRAKPGEIIILHDGGRRGRRTARTLAAVLPRLRGRGFSVCSLAEISPVV